MSDLDLNAEVEIEVPFFDLDPMGVAWHGHYMKYLEQARCALLDKVDYNYDQMEASGYVWPIVNLRVKYVRPLRFRQLIRVSARLLEYENRLKLAYEIRDRESGERLGKAETIQVAVEKSTGEMCFVSPRALLDRLGVDA